MSAGRPKKDVGMVLESVRSRYNLARLFFTPRFDGWQLFYKIINLLPIVSKSKKEDVIIEENESPGGDAAMPYNEN